MSTRLFHFQDDKSDKFWQITVEGSSHTVHFGRRGTTGQAQTKDFGSDAEAQKSAEKLIAEKVKKGYLEEAEGAATSAPTPRVPPAPKAKPASETDEPDPVLESRVVVAPAKVKAAPAKADEPAGEAPAAVAAAAPPAPLLVVDTNEPRRIDLAPDEWRWATWRTFEPRPRPEAPPFDLEEAAARLAKVPASGWQWSWDRARISTALTREEAAFWLDAMVSASYHTTPKELAASLKAGGVKSKLTLEQALTKVRKSGRELDKEIVIPLSNLGSAAEIVAAVIRDERELRNSKTRQAWTLPFQAICEGLREYVLPCLTDAEREAVRECVLLEFIPAEWPLGPSNRCYYTQAPPAIMLAAYLGMHDLVRQVVEAWPDDAYIDTEGWHDYYHRPQQVIFGLGTPAEVELHFRRLKLRLRKPEYVSAWLAHNEYRALDVPRDSIAAETNKAEAEQVMAAFTRVVAPEAAPHMLELMLTSKAPRLAREWLDGHPGHAVAGLIPVAAGRGKLADAAVEYLRALRRKGGEALIAATLERAEPETAARAREAIYQPTEEDLPVLDAGSTPDWLAEALKPSGAKAPKAPAWVSPQDLPSIRVGESRLNDAQVTAVLTALSQSKLGEPHPLVAALRANGDRPSLDNFGWRLFERWLAEGAPAKDRWGMCAIGLLGSDVSALKLTPLIRQWPGESQHQRAVLGLDCLRAIGTDTALMQINGIAQKVPFKGIKTKAAECMESIAADRGMSRAQLEDRIVPDCDLDERGSRTFDFGPRQFRFVLGEGMKPMVKEADGKLRTDLPKPNAKDDAALSAAATEEWKLLKKTVAQVAKVQAVRLEQSMVTGRRWNREEFELLLVRHPLMTNLVRLLVWGGYDEGGALAGTFRVTEDLTYGNSSDEEVTLDRYTEVGVVHPLHLSAEDRAAWGELFADYELVPPFTQLGRQILSLEPSERDQTELLRFAKAKVAPQTLVFTLEKLDWQRGLPEDGGVFYSHSKPFYGANVTAIVQYEGVPVGYMEGWDDQSIEKCYFIPGIWKPDWYADHKNQIPLGEVDPVVISEVLGDLSGIAAKAK